MQGLYLVTPDWDDTERLLACTGAALAAGATLLQYRNKSASAPLRREQAGALLQLCRRHRIPLIINDHLDLCEDLDADGVHVGGTDSPVAHARQRLGPGKIVGASCYGELALARAAQRDGASYVAFGGFYPSLVKQYTFRTDPDLLLEARREIRLPIVVIGGMTPERARPLVERGAHLVAAISAVFAESAPGPAAQRFTHLFPPGSGTALIEGA